MAPILRLMRDALGVAPRERLLVDLGAAALCVAGLGLLGAAAFHALAEAAGPQVARIVLGMSGIALAGLLWAVGAMRARARRRRAAAARAQIADEVRRAALARTGLSGSGLAGPCAAFVLAFLMGRKH